MKTCPECREAKPLDTGFYRRRDGYQRVCKVCDRAGAKARHAASREVSNARKRAKSPAYRLSNRQRWATEDPYANPEPKVCSECGPRPRTDFGRLSQTHDGLRSYCRSCWQMRVQARRAKKKGVYVERVYRHIVWKRDGGICYLCGLPADPARWDLEHIDPIDNGGEHSYVNTAVSHPACNYAKGSKPWPNAAFDPE